MHLIDKEICIVVHTLSPSMKRKTVDSLSDSWVITSCLASVEPGRRQNELDHERNYQDGSSRGVIWNIHLLVAIDH